MSAYHGTTCGGCGCVNASHGRACLLCGWASGCRGCGGRTSVDVYYLSETLTRLASDIEAGATDAVSALRYHGARCAGYCADCAYRVTKRDAMDARITALAGAR